MADNRIEYKKKTYLGEQGDFISQDAFQQYKEKHGEEKALAYLHALNDFTRQLDVILGGGFCRNGISNGSVRVKTNIEKLVRHNNLFLKNFKSEPNSEISSNPAPTV